MKKFDFSFQYLLDAHQAREEAAEHALHTVMKEQVAVKELLQQRHEFRAKQVEVVQGMTGILNRADFAAYIRCIGSVERELTDLQGAIARFDLQITELREKLREEMTSRKVMENLRDREREEWASEMQIEDQKQMDELAVGRWSRQAREI